MSNLFFQVYKHPSDHLKWEKHIEFARTTTDVSEDKRQQWINSLEFLRDELGKGFLKSCGRDHPFYQKVSNKAPWQISELIRLADTLKILKQGNTNYTKLKKKLHASAKYKQEGTHFIDIASDFTRCDFKVSFLDEVAGRKSPDIELYNPDNHDKVFIEVSRLNTSEERDILSANYHILIEELLNREPFVAFSGVQLKVITKEEMPGVISTIQALKIKAVIDNQFEFHEDTWLSLAVVPYSKVKELEEWCTINNREANIRGMPLDFNEAKRIIRNKKIKEKAKQLPKEHMGLIYIPVDPMYFMARIAYLDEDIESLEEEMAQIPNLIGVVLYAHIIDPVPEEKYLGNKHLFSRKMLNDALLRNLLFVYNHSSQMTIKQESLDKIYNSFH
jgi:hypothetical protein